MLRYFANLLRQLGDWLMEYVVFHELRRVYVVKCFGCDRAAQAGDSFYDAELNACKQGWELHWPYSGRGQRKWFCLACIEELSMEKRA